MTPLTHRGYPFSRPAPISPSPAGGEGEIGHMESSFHGEEKGQGWHVEEIEGDTEPDDGARQAAGTRQAGRADS